MQRNDPSWMGRVEMTMGLRRRGYGWQSGWFS